jgi:hypothetical protein
VTPLSGAERTRRWRERRSQGQNAGAGEIPADTDVTGVRAASGNGAGKGPARGYSWPPFEPGNAAAFVHGAFSERAIAPRAEALARAVLEDGEFPDHVRSPVFRISLAAWTRAEAVASLLFDHLITLGAEQMMTPRLAGTRAPVDLWRAADAHAAKLRGELGLSPVSYARIAKDLGIANRASEDALERMAKAGREIRERREAGLRVISSGETV